MFNKKIDTLLDVTRRFGTEKKCIAHLENLYWPGEPISPFDPSSKVYRLKTGEYKCKNTGKKFTVKTGTMFHGTQIIAEMVFSNLFVHK